MEAPWAYHYAGRPDRTAEVVHAVVHQRFGTGRGGLPGNDDSGGLSSWYVWASLGLFPVAGQNLVLLNAPAHEHAEITLGPEVTQHRRDRVRPARAGRAGAVRARRTPGRHPARAQLAHRGRAAPRRPARDRARARPRPAGDRCRARPRTPADSPRPPQHRRYPRDPARPPPRHRRARRPRHLRPLRRGPQPRRGGPGPRVRRGAHRHLAHRPARGGRAAAQAAGPGAALPGRASSSSGPPRSGTTRCRTGATSRASPAGSSSSSPTACPRCACRCTSARTRSPSPTRSGPPGTPGCRSTSRRSPRRSAPT